jgi:tetratricopeptide (TPR) repeat protein
MQDLYPLLIAGFVLTAIGLLFLRTFRKSSAEKPVKTKKPRHRDRNAILKDTGRRLSQNPKDPEALIELGELYFREELWEKAMKIYALLMDLSASNAELDEFEATFRYAISALRLKNNEEAYKGFVIARTLKQDEFEVNFNLGMLEYLRQNFDKAVQLLNQAKSQQPDHMETQRLLGHALFRTRRFKDALVLLRKTVDQEPDDKESLFAMAECYYELGHNEQAIRIFTHLRPDPVLGPSAALFAGSIHLNQRQYPPAIMDFEIGLRHENIRRDILLELKYRLAAAYVKQQEIAKALALLVDIQNMLPGYRDVPEQILKFQELNSNRNLQIYLLAPTSEFLTLCRKICASFFPHSRVKVVDITVMKNEYADILTHVETKKWEDLVLFRCIRTTGQVGELLLRDFHARIKDTKSGRGFCLSAGTFTESAQAFVEARLIDLIDKDKLTHLLHDLDPALAT